MFNIVKPVHDKIDVVSPISLQSHLDSTWLVSARSGDGPRILSISRPANEQHNSEMIDNILMPNMNLAPVDTRRYGYKIQITLHLLIDNAKLLTS